MPTSNGLVQTAALSPAAPSANSSCTFAELCDFELALPSALNEAGAMPGTSESISPQLNDKTGLPPRANPRDPARNDPVPAYNFPIFPFLPLQPAVPTPAPALPTLPKQADLGGETSEVASTTPEPASAPAWQLSVQRLSPFEAFSQVPASSMAAGLPTHGPEPSARAKLDPKAKLDPNLSLLPVPMPQQPAENTAEWCAATANAPPVPRAQEVSPGDPSQFDSPAQGLTAGMQIPRPLAMESPTPSDNIQSPCGSAIPCESDPRRPAVPEKVCIGIQAIPNVAGPQAVAGPVPQDSRRIQDPSPSPAPNRTAADVRTEAAKPASDVRGKEPEHVATTPKLVETSSNAAAGSPPLRFAVQRIPLKPVGDAPPIAKYTVNRSSGVPSAGPFFAAQNANSSVPTSQPPDSGPGPFKTAASLSSQPSTAAPSISPTNAQSGTSADDSSDSPPHKNPAPATPFASQTQPPSSSPQVPSGPQLGDPAAQPPFAPGLMSSPRTDAHAAVPEIARNLEPETPIRTSDPGPVQAAQILNKAAHSEMRIGLNTSAFGNVEVRTVVRSSDVGIHIGSEKGDLRSLLSNDIPTIANALQRQDLHLTQVSFHQQGFAFSSDASAGGHAQARSFALKTHSFNDQITEQPIPEPAPEARPSTSRGGLNILA